MITVTLLARKDCHLCEQVQADLGSLQDEYPHRLVVLDIDDDPDLQHTYMEKVPVVEIGPYRLEAPIDRQRLAITLGAMQHRHEQLTAVEDKAYQSRLDRGKHMSKTDRFSLWFSNHYMIIFNLLVFIYVGLPFLAPVLHNAGAPGPANAIHWMYSGLCHQLSFRSWFLFGEQPVYPREPAGLENYETFEEATGIDEDALMPARRFKGNETVGYKVALCQRDVAIYASILLFGLLFAATGRKWKPLPLLVWLAVALVPIGLDGGSQLVGMYAAAFEGPFWDFVGTIFPPRESTPFLRTLTGFLFGFSTAWFGYPMVEEAMADTRMLLTKKAAQVQER